MRKLAKPKGVRVREKELGWYVQKGRNSGNGQWRTCGWRVPATGSQIDS